MTSTSVQPNDKAGLSLQELISSLADWLKYLWSKWLTLLIAGILGAAIGIAIALLKKPTYTGNLSFVLEESSASPLGAYSGIASQFGFDLGGGFSSGVFSSDNITAFLTSRLMVEKTLLHPVKSGDGLKTLADVYIHAYDLTKHWKDIPALQNISFPANLARDRFSLQQDSILGVLHERIVKKNLSIVKPEKTSTFISVKCQTVNEIFSKVFTERLVYEATNFYVETKTKRSRANVQKLQAKADSIETLLNKKTFAVASSQDMNRNPARSIAEVGTELIARDKIVLQTMYGEVIKNLEISKMTMAQETPIIQIIDSPILPLKKEKFGILISIIAGGFILGFLTVCFLIIRKLLQGTPINKEEV